MGFGRDVRSAIFGKVETFSQAEVNHFGPPSLITRNTNDVQQVQTVVFLAFTIMISAPILIVGGIILAVGTDVPLSGLLVVVIPLMAVVIALVMTRAIPMFQAMQRQGGPHQPGHARDAFRDQGHPCLRAHQARGSPLRRGEPRPVRHHRPRQPAVRRDHPDDDADPEPVDRGRAVVRRHARQRRRAVNRRPDRLPPVPAPDPVRRTDRGVHVHPHPARGRLVGSNPRGSRHRAHHPRSTSNPLP